MQANHINAPYTLQVLCERLRDADNYTYQDACRAADVIEWHAELLEVLQEAHEALDGVRPYTVGLMNHINMLLDRAKAVA